LCCGATVQSEKKPCLLNGVLSQDPPMERYGTAMKAFFRP